MEELGNQAVQQVMLCPTDSVLAAHCKQQGFHVIGFKKTFNIDPFLALRISKICAKEGITHLHAHDSPSHTFAILACAIWGLKLPIIVHRRVDFPIGKSRLSKWKYNHPAIGRIICVSDFIKQVMAPDIKEPKKLVTVHSGIDLNRFNNAGNQLKTNRLRSEFKIPNNQYLIANVAAIAPHKDYITFLETAEKLVNSGFPAMFLAIGGDGGEEEKLRYLIQKKALQNRVLLTGFRNDVNELLPELDLLLFTSKTEGLGTTILDAFACKVPVVASKAGGIPELVENGRTGLLCKVGDVDGFANAVRHLLGDHSLQSKTIENAFQKLQLFTKEKMAASILEIYKQC